MSDSMARRLRRKALKEQNLTFRERVTEAVKKEKSVAGVVFSLGNKKDVKLAR